MAEIKYCLMCKQLHEIWINAYGGELPPMTRQQLINFFLGCYNDWVKENRKRKRKTIFDFLAKEYDAKAYPLDNQHLCPHCGAPLAKSDTKGYAWQCFYCDEDFYNVEVIKQRGDK